MEISRQQLVESANLAMERGPEIIFGSSVPDELRDELMEVAKTVKCIVGMWWLDSVGCGCLVGTARHLRGEDAFPEEDDIEHAIGIAFLNAFREVTGMVSIDFMFKPCEVVD